jgi:hypothetical protein
MAIANTADDQRLNDAVYPNRLRQFFEAVLGKAGSGLRWVRFDLADWQLERAGSGLKGSTGGGQGTNWLGCDARPSREEGRQSLT